MADGTDDVAMAFARFFPAFYLRFHRRDDRHSQVSAYSRGVLQHLAIIGPASVGELCQHLDRAQSVVSEIVVQLEAKDLVERQEDPHDRRRKLVWLTSSGRVFLERDREVLSTDLLRPASVDRRAELTAILARAIQVATGSKATPVQRDTASSRGEAADRTTVTLAATGWLPS